MKQVLMMAALLMLAACGNRESPEQRAMDKWVGKDFSGIVVQTLDGEPQPLKDVAGNKHIVLNVWATWCPPCIHELPTLDALGKSGHAVVVTIATDKDTAKVKDFLREQNWGSGMLTWFDSQGIVTREKMGAAAIPVSYILGPDLKVRRVETGERDWNSVPMIETIEQATSE
jgi:thiol-disulfide isomerase/thioredoxin